MTVFDVLIIHMYLLAVFAVVVKTKINIILYRFIKLGVVFLAVTAILSFVTYGRFDVFVLTQWVKFIPVPLVLVIMVQTEFRLLLRFLGVKSGLLVENAIQDEVKTELLHAIDYLSRHRIGAIITFERSTSLRDFIDNAFQVDAPVSSELLSSIFMPKTPLHDGAVIIKDNVIVCAGAYFPPSDNEKIPKYIGSRHRAAIGISEITDSLTIVVSEETGQISITVDGYLDQDISSESLVLYMEKYLQN